MAAEAFACSTAAFAAFSDALADARVVSKRGLGGVPLGRGHAAFVGGHQPVVVAFGTFHLGLRDRHLRLGAGHFGIAQILRREILLSVDLEKKVALRDLRALGEAHALDVAVDLRQDVRHLRRLHVPDILNGRVEHGVRHRCHGHGRRIVNGDRPVHDVA